MQDLIVYMLEEYPQVRSSATEVLDHPWISVCNKPFTAVYGALK